MPIPLPLQVLTQEEMERLWGTDNLNQIDCARRHSILRDYVIQRDSALRGGK